VMVSLSYFAGQLVPLEQLISFASQFAFIALLLVALAIGLPIWLESRHKKMDPTIAKVVEPEAPRSVTHVP
jgi:hypothetical protein